MLHTIQTPAEGTTQFCGPTAIAALTGLSVEAVENAVLKHRETNKPPRGERKPKGCRVKGMWQSEFRAVVELLGFNLTCRFDATQCRRSVTLGTFAYSRIASEGKPLLVIVTGHAVAMCGSQIIDNAHRAPTQVFRTRSARRRVVWAFTITPKT